MSQAEQQLYAAQQALMQSQFDLLTANVAVRKALGEQ
jgi:outer membrane protein TolC